MSGIRRTISRSIPFSVVRAAVRERSDLLESFLLPVLVLLILRASVNWNVGAVAAEDALRTYYMSFEPAQFYAVVVFILVGLLSGQYATDLGVYLSGAVLPIDTFSGGRPRMWARLSPMLGITMVIGATTLFFVVASSFIPGVSWPVRSISFWIIACGLVVFSAAAGSAVGLAIRDQPGADLAVVVLAYGSAIIAGAFFPYPETSRIWAIARFSPFTSLLYRILETTRDPDSTPGIVELTLWAVAALAAIVVLAQLRDSVDRSTRSPARRADSGRMARMVRWALGNQALIACGVGIVTLPFLVWIAGPVGFVPGDLGGNLALMYPFAGGATVLLFIGAAYIAVPLVTNREAFCRWPRYRWRFLITRSGVGAATIALATVSAASVWPTPVGTLLEASGALLLFFGWSLGLWVVLARMIRDTTAFWAVAIASMVVVTFLGGSLWSPGALGAIGRGAAAVLPNSILLYQRTIAGWLVVVTQTVILWSIGLRRGRLQALLRKTTTRLPSSGSGDQTPPSPILKDDLVPDRDGLVDILLLRERKRILNHVHDTLGHGITGALWQIRSARGLTEDPELLSILDRATDGLQNGLQRIREYLRDSEPREVADWSTLHRRIREFTRCPVDLILRGDAGQFQPLVVQRFTATVEELLTNALRYGEPTAIQIEITKTTRNYRLEYREHGRGWGARGPRLGYGLTAVRALFTELGGSFHLDQLGETNGIGVVGIVPSRVTGDSSGRSYTDGIDE